VDKSSFLSCFVTCILQVITKKAGAIKIAGTIEDPSIDEKSIMLE
jgi:hypothetical protein